MVEIISLPPSLRITDRTDPTIEPFTRSGGVSLSGQEQVITPLAGRWRFAFTLPITSGIRARAWRVTRSKLRGRFNYLQVRICDPYRITRKSVGAWDADGMVEFSDGVPFSDDSAFGVAPPCAPLVFSAPINSTELVVNASNFDGAMTAGVFFSINGWLYLVENWSQDGDNITMQINPPTRAAYDAGAMADFDAKFIGRLDADTEELEMLGGKYGALRIVMIEDVGRIE